MAILECDYLVIGGGTAGCVVAARLSEDPANRVVLLEAGDADSNPLIAIPGALPITGTASRFNWSSYTEPEPDMGGRRLFMSQGRILGGGSSINGMVYTRGQPWDYDQWRDSGCPEWGFEDVLPLFRKSENSARGANHWHGAGGPISVSRGESELPICDEFLSAASGAGCPIVDDFNSDRQEGCGYYDTTVGRGRRSSTAAAFVRPARGRRNLIVITNALAQRLIVSGGRTHGCVYLRHGAVREVRAIREVVVCNGGIRSPQLLMLSGIGPAAQLRQFGIGVTLDASGVGTNLQNHVAYKLQYAVNRPITGYTYLNPLRALGTGLEYVAYRGGYLSRSGTPMGGFLRTAHASNAVPDVQIFLSPALVGRLDNGLFNLLPKEHGFSTFVNQGRPWSRGEIRLASIDAADQPRIIGRYLSDPRDIEVLADGVEMTRDMIMGGRMRSLVEREILPGEAARDRTSLKLHLRENAGQHFHPAGTCRMGEDDEAVVDSRLRVRGLSGLRIADASIMPTLMNGNTAAPIVMIGEKAAEMILEDQARH